MVQKTVGDLKTENTSSFADNTQELITPVLHRGFNLNLLESMLARGTNTLATDVVPMVTSDGQTLQDSSITEGGTEITVAKAAVFQPFLTIGASRLNVLGELIYFSTGISNRTFTPMGAPFTTSGTSNPMYVKLGAVEELPETAQQRVQDETLQILGGNTMSFVQPGGAGTDHISRQFVVNATTTGSVRLEIFVGSDATGRKIVDQEFTLAVGDNTLVFETFPYINPAYTYFVQYTAISTVTIRGSTISSVFIPYNVTSGWPFSEVRVLTDDDGAHIGSLLAALNGFEADDQRATFKKACRVATTANITLSGNQTIDGVTTASGNRVLVKDQTDASENGIYVTAASTWSRATDADANAKLLSGTFVPVSEGTTDADTLWFLATNDPIAVGTTDQTWREFSGTMTTFDAPAITALSISGLTDFTPPIGTELGGSRTLTFTVTNQSNVQGTLEFVWEGSTIATGIDPAAGTAAVTIPSTVTVAANNYLGRLQGTNTRGDSFNRDVTFRSPQDDELAYYGTRATDDFATVDVSTLSQANVNVTGSTYNINLSATNTHFLGILSPNDRDPVSIVDTVLGTSALADFTATLAVRTIGARSYNLLTLQNNSGFDGTFNFDVTTE